MKEKPPVQKKKMMEESSLKDQVIVDGFLLIIWALIT